jgi:hypothetical protein
MGEYIPKILPLKPVRGLKRGDQIKLNLKKATLRLKVRLVRPSRP